MNRYLEGYIQALINVRERELKGANPPSILESKSDIIEDLKRALECSKAIEKLKGQEEVKMKSFVTSGTTKDIVDKISMALNEPLEVYKFEKA